MAIPTMSEANDERTPLERRRDRELAMIAPTSAAASMQLVNPDRVSKIHNPQDLVELASFVQTADNYTKSVVGGKLEQISEQIKHLQRQAHEVLASAKRDVELNHAKCNFKRIPGKLYHLYRKAGADEGCEGTTYFSMLSPKEWGSRQPDTYVDSYRLEYDMSWTLQENILAREKRRTFNPQLLGLENVAAEAGSEGSPLAILAQAAPVRQ